MSASCGGEGGPEEEEVYAELGLESNHAYSILDVRQLGTDQYEYTALYSRTSNKGHSE
jgi:hypothetical protein